MHLGRHGEAWVWVGGPVPPGYAAITLGRLVIVRRRAAGDAHLLRHEMAHVRQWRALGARRFLAAYLGDYVRGRRRGLSHAEAYRAIGLEVEAEEAARDEGAGGLAGGDPPEGAGGLAGGAPPG